MKGSLIGIGVGPGDPELLTLKGYRILNEIKNIVIPVSKKGKESIAKNIIKKSVNLKNKNIIELIFPMSYDEFKLNEYWDKAVNKIKALLDNGEDVVFITLGDISIYSTFMYIEKRIKNLGYKVNMIPGVTSFCASASFAGISLGENNDKIIIVPSPEKENDLEKIIKDNECIVFMKVSKSFNQIINVIDKLDLLKNAVMVSRCGHGNQEIIKDLKNYNEKDVNYMSTIILKK
jgi:precorrin-2/cobalt-factor-2 C20-methyltransferase